jgi:hypothetical protein
MEKTYLPDKGGGTLCEGVHIALTSINLVNEFESCKAWLTAELVQLVVQDNFHLYNLLVIAHCTLMHGHWWGLVIAHLVILLHACLCAKILWMEADILCTVTQHYCPLQP